MFWRCHALQMGARLPTIDQETLNAFAKLTRDDGVQALCRIVRPGCAWPPVMKLHEVPLGFVDLQSRNQVRMPEQRRVGVPYPGDERRVVGFHRTLGVEHESHKLVQLPVDRTDPTPFKVDQTGNAGVGNQDVPQVYVGMNEPMEVGSERP